MAGLTPLKLPRQVELDPRCKQIEAVLAGSNRPLWDGGTVVVPHLEFSAALEAALKRAHGNHQLERGLEHIEVVLRAEQKGQSLVREKEGTAPAYRLSRLLILPDGCPERFYRTAEALLFNHAERVLGLRVDSSFEQFAQSFLGDALVKAVLVAERAAVADVLYSLI